MRAVGDERVDAHREERAHLVLGVDGPGVDGHAAAYGALALLVGYLAFFDEVLIAQASVFSTIASSVMSASGSSRSTGIVSSAAATSATAELRQHAIAEQQNQDSADPEARRNQRQDHPQAAAQIEAASSAGAIFEMFAFGSFAETHDDLSSAASMRDDRYGCN